MTTYRVGSAGADVFDDDGALISRLPPGAIVVEAIVETAPNAPARRAEGYADTRLRPAADTESPR